MQLLQLYKNFINRHSLFREKDKLLLAVSGGVDSVVLCELSRQAGYDFVIAHCNFKLRGKESDRDKEFVKDLAQKHKVPFLLNEFDTDRFASENKLSTQEAARKLRYDWFYKLLDSPEFSLAYILTAHHADDNIETVLMNFFRGTGIKGLRGMEPKQGKIVRPLLFARRKQLEDFIKYHHLDFVTDSSNLADDYSRNYLRLTVLPFLEKIYPEVTENLLQNIERCKEIELLYNEAIEMHRRKLMEYKGEEIHIPVLKLKKLNPLRSVLYEIVKEWGFRPSQVYEIIRLLDSESGKYIFSASHRILKNRNWLIVTPLNATTTELILIEEGISKINFSPAVNEINSLDFEIAPVSDDQRSAASHIAFFDKNEIQFPLILRKWKAGDYFYPIGMKVKSSGQPGKKKLSRFFIDQKLSKADKEKIRVLEMNKKIIWIIGHRIDDRVKITDRTKSVLKVTYTKLQTG